MRNTILITQEVEEITRCGKRQKGQINWVKTGGGG